MLRNSLPNLRKTEILSVRETLKEERSKQHRRHSASRMTPWQIIPVLLKGYVEPVWHQVYQGRHKFVEARGGIMLVTADLEALHAYQASVRPSAERWLRREEIQDIHVDDTDAQGIALGKIARQGITNRRLPTRWRIWYRPSGRRDRPDTASNTGWHRVYATTEAGYLYIETGHEHLLLDEHRELFRQLVELGTLKQGIIKIDKQEFVDWLSPDGETIIQD